MSIVVLASVTAGTLVLHALIFSTLRHLFGALGEPGKLLAQVFTKNLRSPTRIVLPLVRPGARPPVRARRTASSGWCDRLT